MRCPSISSTPLYSQSLLRISPMSFLICPHIAFRLYFGVNTMWYLHIHFVCERLRLLGHADRKLSARIFDGLNIVNIRRKGVL